MQELCGNCRLPEKQHGENGHCLKNTPGFDDPHEKFQPSGRVSVPKEFIESVARFIENDDFNHNDFNEICALLDQIEKE